MNVVVVDAVVMERSHDDDPGDDQFYDSFWNTHVVDVDVVVVVAL